MLKREGKRTKLVELIHRFKLRLEQTNNEDEIDKIELELAIAIKELSEIDKLIDNNKERILDLTTKVFQSENDLNEKSKYFDEVKPYRLNNHKEFNSRRKLFLDSESKCKNYTYDLAQEIPTVLDWYKLPEINMEVYKYNDSQIEVRRMKKI